MTWTCDKLLEIDEPSRYKTDEIKKWKVDAFKEAFTFHYEKCPEYNRYCKIHNVKPSDIKTYEDLVKIQPIPSDGFRDPEKLVASISPEQIVLVLTTSSTTSKHPIRYPIDKVTLPRMTKINSKSWKDGHELKVGSIFFLTPRPQDSDTGLVKGAYFSFKEMGFSDQDIYFCVKENKLDFEDIAQKIETAKKPVHIYGPPFAHNAFVDFLEEKGLLLKLDEDTRIITTGGWKTVKNAITRSDLDNKISKCLGVPSKNIRDGYGSTDILTMLPECEYHNKHIPPWFHISIRDPENLNQEMAEGETGLTVLMSNYIASYPAFIMPGDLGVIRETGCSCGRNTPTIEIKGRAKGSGARGCAIRLEEFMEIISKKQ